MKKSIKKILEDNIKAVELAYNLVKENKAPSNEELEILNEFSGWGGIKALLHPIDKDWKNIGGASKADLALETQIKTFYRFVQDNLQNFQENTQNVWELIRESCLTSFYTPKEFTYKLFYKLKENNPNLKTMLDPSSGTGRFADGFLAYYPQAEVTAVEQDFLTALILKAKYIGKSNVNVINKGFEDVNFQNKKFDIVASNIPFGNFSVMYPQYDKKITDKIHNFFFYHGINLLEKGGLLMYLTSAGVFNSPNNSYIRDVILDNTAPNALISMPNNFFDDTEVTSHLYIGSKNRYIIDYNSAIDLKADENGVYINPLLKYFSNDIQLSTNPYGQTEYNYQLPLEDVIQKMDVEIEIPNLDIKREAPIKELSFDFYPLGFESLANIDFKRELDLLRLDIPEDEKRNFSVVSVIKANYRGKTIPIATICKINDETKSRYFIDSYINTTSLYKPKRGFIAAKEFVQEFDYNFIPSLQEFCKEFNLKVWLDTRRENNSEKFEQYFYERFTQPYLSYSYTLEFDQSLHREAEVGMVVLNKNGKPSKITNIFIENDNIKVYELEEIQFTNSKTENLLVDFLAIYDAYNKYNKALINKDVDNIPLYNKLLNHKYDLFVKKHGYINDNKLAIKQYDNYYFSVVSSLENFEAQEIIDLFTSQNRYTKADIFFLKNEKETQLLSIKDALVKSLGQYAAVKLDFIKELTGKEDSDIIAELQDDIILNPLTNDYELKTIFLSGDIYDKIENIQKLPQNNHTAHVLEELNKVLPEPIPYFSISKQFGSRWIPIKIYEKFLSQYFTANFNLHFDVQNDLLTVGKATNCGNKYITRRFLSSRYITPELIAENAFYNTYPIVTYTVGTPPDERQECDKEATEYYKREIIRLRRNFDNYLLSLDEQTQEELTTIYNRRFNGTVLSNINGDILNFEEFDLKSANIPSIYQHQKDAVWKMICSQGGIVDHEVGLGKTFTMVAESHFLKKFNICQKPIIIGLKANVKDIAETYKKLLPNAKILFASEKDYAKENREVFLNKIKNNDWDAIIMSHNQFGFIPQSLTVQLDIMRQELKDVEDNLFSIQGMDVSKKQLAGLIQRKKNLTRKISDMVETINMNKDKGVLYFDDLGIDHIIIDESHFFKNLMYQTRHTRVAGLGNLEGSQRSLNILTAIKSIQERTPSGELGASFYSGTPISNSLTELYLLQKYLTPKTLERKGIQNFDSWASVFAKKTIEFETNMVNDIVAKERFRYYENLPELAGMYCNIAHVMTGEQAGIDRPRKKESLLLNDQTPSQKRFYHKLSRFLKDGDQEKLNLGYRINVDEKSTALSIVAMNLAFKASLDMRLINGDLYRDEKNSKINELVKDTLNNYHLFDEYKGTQIIFCDISPSTKKISFQELEDNYNNGIFTSLYDDIKYKLIKGGVKEEEIAFIQHYDNEKKKAMLSEKMNNGEIRVLLGGTQNAGTGLNVQKRLISIKHLSIPWKPSELDQRNGRGFRKGNWLAKAHNNNEIDIKMCATSNTLDAYKVDLNKNKSQFIGQIKNYALGHHIDRVTDEGVIEENTGMNLAEFHAQITGDNTLLEKFKVDKKIKELEQEKLFVLNEIATSKNKLNTSYKRIEELNRIVSYCKTDLEEYKKNVVLDEKGTRINTTTYVGLSEEDHKDEKKVFEFLKVKDKEARKISQSELLKVGELYGFDLMASNSLFNGVEWFIRNKNKPMVRYSITGGRINFNDKSLALSYFMRCFDSIQRRIDNNLKDIDREQLFVAENEKRCNVSFEKETELKEAIEYSDNLDKLLRKKQEEVFKLPTINKEDMTISVIDSLEAFDKAIECDLVGTDKKDNKNYLYVSDDVCELMEYLAEQNNSPLDIFYNQKDTNGLNLLGFKIEHYEKLFLLYSEEKEEYLNKLNNKGLKI